MSPSRRSRRALIPALLALLLAGCHEDGDTIVVGGGGNDLNQIDAAAAAAEALHAEDFHLISSSPLGADFFITARADNKVEIWRRKADAVTARPRYNRVGSIPLPFTHAPARVFEGVATPGSADLFVQTAGGVVWFEGLPNGAFAPALNLAVSEFIDPLNAHQLIVADLTGNGASDLAFVQNAVNQGAVASIVVYHNNGAGAFTLAQNVSMPTGFVEALIAADVNADNRTDLVAATVVGTFPFLTQPDGTLLHLDPATGLAQPTPATPLASSIDGLFADVVASPRPDLILCDPLGGLTIYPANDNGSFAAPILLHGPTLLSPVVADFNLDGVPDIAAASQTDDAIRVFFGPFTSDGAAPLVIPVAESPSRLFAVDLFDRARPDLVSFHRQDNLVQFTINDPVRGFLAPTRLPLTDDVGSPLGAEYAAIADVNGDNYADLVIATQSFSIATALNLADGSGALAPLIVDPFGLPPLIVEPLAPFDPSKDARQPIVATFDTFGEAAVLLLDTNTNPHEWSLVQLLPSGAQPLALAVADLDGDGREDVVCAHDGGAPTLSSFRQTSPAFFEPTAALDGVPGAFDRLALARLDNDPAPDAILADSSTGQLRVHLGNGFGGFHPAPAALHALTPPLSNIVIADVNDDGLPDVIVASGAGAATIINVFHSLGSGSLALTASFPAGREVRGLRAADMTRDGLPDLAILLAPQNSYGSALLRVVLNNNGALDPAFYPSAHFAHVDPVWFARADLHNPISRAGSAPEVIILAEDAPFPYEGITILPALDFAQAPCPGDANGDRAVDFLDLNIVLSFFGTSVTPGTNGDLNNDGAVDFLDLNIVLSFFGTAC